MTDVLATPAVSARRNHRSALRIRLAPSYEQYQERPLVFRHPQLAFHLLCTKDLG